MDSKLPVSSPVDRLENGTGNSSKEKKKREHLKISKQEKGRGIVKAVLSGDTIIVVHLERNQHGPPLEREITISNIVAPKLGRRKTAKKPATADENFAWASREWLRKLVIGKQVSYVIDYLSPSKEKAYGNVFLITGVNSINESESASSDRSQKKIQQENLAKLIVAEGWALVRRPSTNRPELSELYSLEEAATLASRGMHDKSGASATPLGPLKRIPMYINPPELFERLRKTPQEGIVEQVLSGNMMRIYLLPELQFITLLLSGVDCPQVSLDVSSGSNTQPFGREAKFFTEYFVLHRNVKIVLEGVDKFHFYGTVSVIGGGNSINESLLQAGLGKFVDWSGQRSPFAEQWKAAERSAREKHLRLWKISTLTKESLSSSVSEKNPPPPPHHPHPHNNSNSNSNSSSSSSIVEDRKTMGTGMGNSVVVHRLPAKELIGRVSRILSGGWYRIVVVAVMMTTTTTTSEGTSSTTRRDTSHHYYDIYLSSIRIPRQGNVLQKKEESREEAIERSLAWEAKEYARKRLIGQRVRCLFDYSRPELPRKDQAPLPERPFFSVYLPEKGNVAVELVERGLAQVLEHRGGEVRSRDYEALLFAEERARREEKGLWAPKDRAPIVYLNDLSLPSTKIKDSTKAGANPKNFLPFLKRAGRQRAVVEHVYTGTRVKLYVPKEACLINFSFAAVKCPRITERSADPFAKEAMAFTEDRILQHDVEFEVFSQDKSGNFIGLLWFNKENIAIKLLEEGLATINRVSLKELEQATEFIIAEDTAKKANRNLWKDYDAAVEEEKRRKRLEEEQERRTKQQQEYLEVIVTEIIDACKFFIQVSPDAEREKLEELMQRLQLEAGKESVGEYRAKVGEVVKCQFSSDGKWYRAKVLSIREHLEGTIGSLGPRYTVSYIDYGNEEEVDITRLRRLDASFVTLRPQAQEARLAYVRAPAILAKEEEDEDSFAVEAAETFRELVWGKTMLATVEHREGDCLALCLWDRESGVLVNAALLMDGLARLERIRGKQYTHSVVEKLREAENKARSQHLRIWEYGDPGSDEDDEDLRRKSRPGR